MQERFDQILSCIQRLEGVTIKVPFNVESETIKGTVEVTVELCTQSFDVHIHQQYPFQFHDLETIRFFNKQLIEADHVNWDGSICIHTQHSPDLLQKLQLDFDSLKAWMLKYLVKNETDQHYEHVIVPAKPVNGVKSVMLFTDVEYSFQPGEFGQIQFSHLANGAVRDLNTTTYFLQSLKLGKNEIKCKWSKLYQAFERLEGIFVFLEKPPVTNRRFILDNWQDLNGILSQEFLSFLNSKEQALSTRNYGKLSLLVGYPISDSEIHWQLITIEKNGFPVYTEKIHGARRMFIERLKSQEILWGETKNCSYSYFFGRGALSERLTQSKIMILGVGAVGSMVANTLCRGGCIDIHTVDYDAKEPENVCRSEYQFFSGINNKVDEIHKQLSIISPFVEVSGNMLGTDAVKLFIYDTESRQMLQDYFNSFDLIIDCTADNDMAYLINKLDLQKDVINLSITNHAKELVCVTNPNLHSTLMHIFNSLRKEEDTDLYNPTGCWNPTFKAGYNDIAVLVQFAIKQINLCYLRGKPLRSFYLSSNADNDFNITLNQF